MCKRCEEREIDRRSLLALAGFGVAAAGFGFGLGIGPAAAADAKKTSLTPDQALAALKEGNARYVSNPQVCVADLARRSAPTWRSSQAPWADHRRLLRQPRPARAAVRRPGARPAVRRPQRRQHGGYRDHGHDRVWRRAPRRPARRRARATSAAARSRPPARSPPRTPSSPGSIGPMVKPIVPAAMAMKGKPGDFVDNTAVRESAKRTATKVAAQPDPVAPSRRPRSSPRATTSTTARSSS